MNICLSFLYTERFFNAASDFTLEMNKFSFKDFFSNCEQILRKLRIWSHLLKKSLKENFIFCAVIH